ncbi:MAG: BMP family ABC transporter substrate-binding protein [Oscillospiraceae bacterium]|nr:BMP family ABC transporter substrate-binding protein [Oscillospiraceae bacterium]
MKKALSLLTAVMMVVGCLASCAKKSDKVDIGLILTEKSMINDGNFNQSAWEGIQLYAEQNDLTYRYYQPDNKSEEFYLKAVEVAVDDGVSVLVTLGHEFATSLFIAQEQYPHVNFILIDGTPNNGKYDSEYFEEKITPNAYSVLFADEQAGFLAGYAIVKDGFRNLGFIGGRAVPAVVAYGYGFVQGAEFAAKELGLVPGEVTIKYDYSGDFSPTPETQAKTSSWYNDGVEVIFAAGGGMGYSVMQAAQSIEGKWVIGADKDQSVDSPTIITSAKKMIARAVYLAIESYYQGNFPGGQIRYYSTSDGGSDLEMENAKFRSFSVAEYERIYNMLATDENGIASSIVTDTAVNPSELPCEYVIVEV